MVYATVKVMWEKGRKQESFDFLREFCATMARDVVEQEASKAPHVEEIRHLLARSYLKQGEWHRELIPTWTSESIEDIVNCYQMATEFDPGWSKAWHSWALCNFDVINHLEALDGDGNDTRNKLILQYILAAIKGKFSLYNGQCTLIIGD